MESKAIDGNYVLQQLKWRYATKKFDATRKIPNEHWSVLKQSLILSPSSFGLQPWKFVLVENAELKSKLVEHSWGQQQPAECSHFVVLTARTSIDSEYVQHFINRIAEVRKVPLEKLAGYQSVVEQFIARLDPVQLQSWMKRQVYIALGQLMSTAALMEIDACPMEGIDPQAYDNLLGLSGNGFSTLVACALGYRDASDYMAVQAKVRFAEEEVFFTV